MPATRCTVSPPDQSRRVPRHTLVVYFQHTAPDPTDEQRELLAALGVRHFVGQVAQIETTNDVLSAVVMADGQVITRDAVGIATFLRGRTDLVADLGLAMAELDMGGTVVGTYLPADAMGLTAAPGVWAAGNVNAPMAQVITSAAAGAAAGAAIHMDLMAEDNQIAVHAYRGRTQNRNPRYWDHRVARMVEGPHEPPTPSPGEEFWEPFYAAGSPGTGGPNPVLVDVSTTALGRVTQRAVDAGVGEGVSTDHHDLTRTFPAGAFDLVSAQFLLSPVEFDRLPVFARAAAAVRPGGMLLIVDHASVPPWSWADPDTEFPDPREALNGIGVDLAQWDITRLENSQRTANGPDGQSAVVTDMVIALTRRGTPSMTSARSLTLADIPDNGETDPRTD